jgi:hypothetical protein
MKGVVEVYRGDELICKEENLIVDAGAEKIADIMTVSPSLAAIPTASALLDTSNYNIQSYSTGKDASAFLTNAHSSSITTFSLVSAAGGLFRITYSILTSGYTTSSYFSTNSLPDYPDPLDTQLQVLPSSVNSLIRDHGQNVNIIGLWRSGLSATPTFSSLNISSVAYLGCYPEKNLGYGNTRIILLNPSGGTIVSTVAFGTNINFYSAVDWRGFARPRLASDTIVAAQSLSSVSATTVSSGEVVYEFRIGADDARLLNVFGGVNILGLWTIDIDKTLNNGVTAPFTFDNLQPKIEYKLFCKKVFNRNLIQVQDGPSTAGININHQTVRILWRISFI